MNLPPFLLDQWLMGHHAADPPMRYDLASSTGPKWTLGALQALGNGLDLSSVRLSYAPPQGSLELRTALGRFLGVDPDWVIVTTGASEAISILFCLAADPGADVVLPAPGFSAFDAMAGAWGLGVRHYELDREAGYAHDPHAIVATAGPETALALVNTPHNPTGAVASEDVVAELAAAFAARGVPLIVDEVYHPLHFDGSVASAAGVDNVILVGDMSKALSLAGLRTGWIVEKDPARRERIVEARSYFTISGSPLLERIAAHALDNSADLLERLKAVASANLSCLDQLFAVESDLLGWVRPAGGTVSFPWFRDGRDSRSFCETLAKAGVLVAPGDCFGQADHMRLGFAAQAEGFAEALELFKGVLHGRPPA